jgi:hydroxymethylglutaryl-CoA synthase
MTQGKEMIGITAFGGYVPRLRLNRQVVVDANAWFNPGLRSLAKGERAFCNWDEDSLTMAIEAARDCMADRDRKDIAALFVASTTLPFSDRQNATIAATALNLDENLNSLDITSSQRAGTSGLLTSLKAQQGRTGTALFIATEKRAARSASEQELHYGDGAAAFALGSSDVIAEFLAAKTIAVDFVDHFRGQHERFDYSWENRWIRDEGYNKIVPGVIRDALEDAGLASGDINHFILPAPSASISKRIAKSFGVPDEAVRDDLHGVMGNSGAAHALVMLAHTLQDAGPDENILVVGWGQGVDALLFRTTEQIGQCSPPMGISGFLTRRREETNYHRYLAFNGLVELEKGIRAENDTPTAMTALYRERETVLGLVGGKCRKCGTIQFPKTNICVNPNCGAIRSQDSKSFADTPARIQSWTADRLSYSPDPPAHYGMINFEGGGRCMVDFTDVDLDQVSVDMQMRMAFRIKEYDERRGFTKYFWKAQPTYNALPEGTDHG